MIILFGVGLIGFHLFLLTHLQFTAWPEMLSYPYLINNNFLLYRDIVQPYQPLLPIILAFVYRIFGLSTQVLELFTWSLIILNDLLLLTLSLKIQRRWFGLIPLVLYVVVQPFWDGNMLWFDLATTPFILLGLVFYQLKQKTSSVSSRMNASTITASAVKLRRNHGRQPVELHKFVKNEKRRWLMLGFWWAVAALTKQQFGLVLVAISGLMLFTPSLKRWIGWWLMGVGLPIISVLIGVLVLGIWNDYWFWSVVVPIIWYPKMPGYAIWPNLNELVKALAVIGPVLILFFWRRKQLVTIHYLAMLLTLLCFLGAFPRFEFLRMQPALLAATFTMISLIKSDKRMIGLLVLTVVLNIFLWRHFWQLSDQPQVRFDSQADRVRSQLIAENTQDSRRLLLVGVDSLNYVRLNMLPPHFWADNYLWYQEIPGVVESEILSMDQDQVRYVIMQQPQLGRPTDLGVYRSAKLLEYIQSHYEQERQLGEGLSLWRRVN